MPVQVDLEGLHIINYSNGTLKYIRDDDLWVNFNILN